MPDLSTPCPFTIPAELLGQQNPKGLAEGTAGPWSSKEEADQMGKAQNFQNPWQDVQSSMVGETQALLPVTTGEPSLS